VLALKLKSQLKSLLYNSEHFQMMDGCSAFFAMLPLATRLFSLV